MSPQRWQAAREPVLWMLGVVVVLGIALTVALVTLNAQLAESNANLERGRYERLTFQRDLLIVTAESRRLVCLDLQDGDTPPTREQVEGCEVDAIPIPPPPDNPATAANESEQP